MLGSALATMCFVAAISARYGSTGRADTVTIEEAGIVVRAPASGTTGAGARPVYRHSIVPGGVYGPGELRESMTADSVVAAHYAPLATAAARVERAGASRRVYMSYRVGNRVYWTKGRVVLNEGETLLTGGGAQIRARCGNRISETPMLPTSNMEPGRFEFDLVMAPTTVPTVFEAPAAPLAALTEGSIPGLAALVPAAPAPIGTSMAAFGTSAAGGYGLAPLPGVPIIPGGAMPPSPLGFTEGPMHPPLAHILLPPPRPTRPATVPEPGTLVLVVTGVGAYVIRRGWRGRS